MQNIRKTVFSDSLDLSELRLCLENCQSLLNDNIEKLLKCTSTGVRTRIQSKISELLSYKEIFKLKIQTSGDSVEVVGKGIDGSGVNVDVEDDVVDDDHNNDRGKSVKWCKAISAFKSRIQTFVITNLTHKDPKGFLEEVKLLFRKNINEILQAHRTVKVNAIFCGEFKVNKSELIKYDIKYFTTPNRELDSNENFEYWLQTNIIESILVQLEEFQERDSGWALSKIINLTLCVNKFNRFVASSYIQLPKEISRKHACVNVVNFDNACFAWAVISAMYPSEQISNTVFQSTLPDYVDQLNLTGIEFPMTIRQIPLFEKLNSEISVNVFTLTKTKRVGYKVISAFVSKKKAAPKHINLLMFKDNYEVEADNDDDDVNDNDTDDELTIVRYHFCWIKDLSRLVSSSLSKNNRKKYICNSCLHYFASNAKLERHMEDCRDLNSCRINLPYENSKIIKFKNYRYKIVSPFVIYSDLECILKPCNNSNNFQEHVPCSIGFFMKCSYDDTLSVFKSYRGEDCIEWFILELEQISIILDAIFSCPLEMVELTPRQKHNYQYATICHICENTLNDCNIDNPKVRDHCHLTGQFRGAAHSKCNINFKDDHIIPIIFHNLSGYDSHFIIKNLATDFPGHIDLLPINKEKYISFSKNVLYNSIKFRFIDSYKFMSKSLASLVSNLYQFPILQSEFQSISNTSLNLLTRKGVYPYDYVDSFDKFNDTVLPTKLQFYNNLNDTNITDEDYAHAQEIWCTFNIKNLGEYSDLYLKTDILLLADVFEQFRYHCTQTYKLDPCHYFTLPGYTWDAMLFLTKINLDLLTDIDMVLFVERGIRGGLSQCSKRYSKANHQYLNNYDSNSPNNFIMYFDINNQYGWAMSQYLPYRDFQWLNNWESFQVDTIDDESPIGYILEIDLEYPKELHDSHSDLPFCPENGLPPNSKQHKLLASLHNKTRYVIHYRNLKYCLANGLKLLKIHRILQFRQSPWLKEYIDLNTQLRKNAKNEFEKDLFKLMNNAVFGKTMENVRKYSIVKLKTKWGGRYGANSLLSSPNFKNCTIFGENLVIIEMNKAEILFNKPIYVGMAVLDISKIKIYNFHYDYMRPTFDDNCNILYTDTDSLVYEIACNDIYEIIKRDCKNYFDTSDYHAANKWNIPLVNKKVLGLMKDEMCGRFISEFVGLRSKLYAIRVEDEDKIKKAKGVKTSIIKNNITVDDYLNCLNIKENKIVCQNLIRSKNHTVHSIRQNKIALSPHDDKRSLIPDSYCTLPWGHFKLEE